MASKLELLPAVDVRDGQAVRLVHGESDVIAAARVANQIRDSWFHS